MLVSIIIPIYNAASYLEKCLNSVINQSYSSLEIILINDGSTDNSGTIINKYKEKDSRIVAFHKTNGGIGSAYKVAFELMTGDYVLFVDSDDWLELKAVESLVSLAIENNADMVSFGIKPQDDKGEVLNLATFDNIDLVNATNESVLKTHFEVLKHPTLVRLYKKELFENVVVFEQNIGIDEMLTPQLLLKCNKAVYTKEVFYNVLIRPNSVCRASVTALKIKQVIKVYGFILNLFEEQLDDYLDLFVKKYYNILIGCLYETMGSLDFETHKVLMNEIVKLRNKITKEIKKDLSFKMELYLQLLTLLPIKWSFQVAKFIGNSK
jgi:glycosyltransferase involved in cell wall biosynthesis